ncbi:MAG: dihydropteroate synthase [Bacteroidetes bacterium]|uniref:dihydropteroate synthase n=1 Tax=Candidatus Cryptobacteroides excrementavium TaxID=2840759 RepID=A0A9D9J4L3_9BACT|nr:dihydropteroate synthase [Candidatus Cryptobacteroides excrementavium]
MDGCREIPVTEQVSKRKIQIMGIVNLTDDSYFAPSRCLGTDGRSDMKKVLGRVSRMLEEGADIIDIGACSTRPGSEPVGEEEEWRRLEPALKAIKDSFPDAVISIDTWWVSVVEKAAGLIGPFIVNDISAGEDDPGMLPAVGRLGLKYIAMHKRGIPKTMQSLCNYRDVTGEVLQYFREFAERADKAGIRDWILDPGFGFAKDTGQNWQLLRELDTLRTLGHRILVGVSRKSMIYRLFGITPEESLAQTQVLHFAALERGADILRVHDVAEAARTIEAYRRLM